MNAARVRHVENALYSYDKIRAQPLDLFLHSYFKSHRNSNPRDQAWITEHVYDLVRWKGLLDYVTPPPVTWSNRLKTYFISDRWRAHSMNEKLPGYIRCSTSKELFERIENAVGTSKAVHVCNILNESPRTFLRVNTNKVTRDRLFKFLVSKGVPIEKCVNSSVGLMLSQTYKLTDLPEFKARLFEMQDESSQLIGFKVQCEPGQFVMDYCAGTGGKATCFGTQMVNTGVIYLHDVNAMRLMKAKSRLMSAGIKNFVLTPPGHPKLSRIRSKMDWVVVDVPCSVTGAIRRNPDVKWTFTNERLAMYIAQQRSVFESALQYLKPGGKIVYSTCSILDDENIHQVQYFCHKHGLCLTEKPYHALPQTKGMDGFFCAVLEKKPIEC
eukprot:GHVL01029418.1.p1 GENE.GHVL01029418.1~~GHVL01029418.1.p1  ORF type:complete len:383 (+),score=47.49 GHVL01029418.1:21-1169(+)